MKKTGLTIYLILLSVALFAQDKESSAYKTGYALGKVVGAVLIAVLVIWGISKLFKGK